MDDIMCFVTPVAACAGIVGAFVGVILLVGWLSEGWPCARRAKAYDMETVWTINECYIKTPEGTMSFKTFEEKLRNK